MQDFLGSWATWGVFISFLVALTTTVLLFGRGRQGYSTALLIYRIVAVVALVLSIPALLLSPTLNLGLENVGGNATQSLVWLSLLAGVAALVVLVLAFMGVGVPDAVTRRPAPTPVVPSFASSTVPATFSTLPPPLPAGESPPPLLPLSGPTVPGAREVAPTELDLAPRPPEQRMVDEPEMDQTMLLGPARDYYAWLVEVTGARPGSLHRLNPARGVIGRGPEAIIRLQDSAVSSQHAVLLYDEEHRHFVLQDLASANGTYLQGERLREPRPLHDGDRVRIGETQLHFMEIHVSEAAQTSSLGAMAYPFPVEEVERDGKGAAGEDVEVGPVSQTPASEE
jgi:hypothetical protein